MESVLKLVTVLLIFVFVLVITILTTRFVADYSKKKQTGSGIELLSAARITQNQFVQIVRVGKKYHVLAVSKDNITKIDEMSEEDYQDSFCDGKKGGFESGAVITSITDTFSEKLKQAQRRLSGK